MGCRHSLAIVVATFKTMLDVIWKPIPGTSQELALATKAHHTLYTGARGPGKSDTQLMRFRMRVGTGYGPFWRGIIFDREYKNLDDLVAKSKRWFRSFGDGATFLGSSSTYKWQWPTGEELLFRAVKDKDDYWDFHGQEFPYIGWNELTKYPDSSLYDSLMSCNRSSFTPEKDNPLCPPIPLEVFSTCNPYGVGHGWVKRRFIDPAPYGVMVKATQMVFNPKTKEREPITKTQVAIFGSYKENIYLSPEYIMELENISDENMRKAWLEGDWNIVAGGAFDDLWRPTVHVLDRFKVPCGWALNRSMDWGSTHPFSVGWWAEANGESAENGFCPPPGTLIQIAEWYGAKEVGLNQGLKMSAVDIANGIKDIEDGLIKGGWIVSLPWAGPADNQIRDVREIDVDSIESKMAKAGVRWTQSDKSPGSRKIGLQLMRDRLEASIRNDGPGIFFMDNCRASIATLPVLPRDPRRMDDIDTQSEDHAYDMVRYRVLAGSNRLAKEVKVKYVY